MATWLSFSSIPLEQEIFLKNINLFFEVKPIVTFLDQYFKTD